MKRGILSILTLFPFIALDGDLQAQTNSIRLALRTRDPKTNQVVEKTENLDASKTGIVIVDPWNYHCCMTWTAPARYL